MTLLLTEERQAIGWSNQEQRWGPADDEGNVATKWPAVQRAHAVIFVPDWVRVCYTRRRRSLVLKQNINATETDHFSVP